MMDGPPPSVLADVNREISIVFDERESPGFRVKLKRLLDDDCRYSHEPPTFTARPRKVCSFPTCCFALPFAHPTFQPGFGGCSKEHFLVTLGTLYAIPSGRIVRYYLHVQCSSFRFLNRTPK
jgi:hypothetical protein